MEFRKNTAVLYLYIVNMQKAPWWIGTRPEFLVHCVCHTKLIPRCWYSLTTPAKKTDWCRMDFWNNTASVQCLHSEHAGPPCWTSWPELLVHCVCHPVLKFTKLARGCCSLITPTNKASLTDAGWSFEKIKHGWIFTQWTCWRSPDELVPGQNASTLVLPHCFEIY